jgi:murein DD-endopeptidase MepM/ murein hydrolase activator NlpD
MITPKSTILAQSVHASARRSARTPTAGQWIAAALFGVSGAAAFSLVANTAPEMTPIRAIRVDLPQPAVSVVAAEPAGYWREDRIRRGDTIGSVLARLGVDDPAALEFLRTSPSVRPLYQLRPGKPLSVETDDEGWLINLRFVHQDGDRLTIAARGTSFGGRRRRPVKSDEGGGEIRVAVRPPTRRGLPDAVTLQMVTFLRRRHQISIDLRRGDRFRSSRNAVHRRRTGWRCTAAEFENRGRAIRALLWRGDDGREGYFSDDGAPLRKAFLRSPMEFSRVTSGFSNARFHPIMQDWRAHKGVDYAAPTGTPVRATGNAKVTFAGKQNGYGNVIELRHQGTFSTLYAPVRSAPQVRGGARVAQGEMIGYVGQTGWATGPTCTTSSAPAASSATRSPSRCRPASRWRPRTGAHSPSGWRRLPRSSRLRDSSRAFSSPRPSSRDAASPSCGSYTPA